MADQKKYSEIISEVLRDAPAARQALADNYRNLHNVADYCEKNYLLEEEPSRAVEAAKALTAQALASVAYQIHSLAAAALRLLDAQGLQIRDMTSSVSVLSLAVAFHQENVARREIGLFTTQKKRGQAIPLLPPAGPEAEQCYNRDPIDYSCLDSIGHCFLVSSQQPRQTGAGPSVHSAGSGLGIAVAPPSVPSPPSSSAALPPAPPHLLRCPSSSAALPPAPPPHGADSSSSCVLPSLAPPPPPSPSPPPPSGDTPPPFYSEDMPPPPPPPPPSGGMPPPPPPPPPSGGMPPPPPPVRW